MVEIREEEDGQQSQAAGDNNTNANAENTQQQNRKTPMEFVKENPNEMLGFVLRLATIYFVLSYLLPLTNPHYQKMAYTKALATAAATNAFRLHQRLRTVNVPFFSQQFLYELMIEDSAHYLLYSIILVMSSPITLALLPISIYALFNIVNFLNKISTEVGYISASLASWLVQIKQQHTANLLSTASCAEIFLFPIIVSMVFMGKTNLFTPFVYYRFLTMRYLSRRNPYTRAMFGQLKLLIFSLANRGGCPTFVRSLIFKSVSFIEQLAPQIPV